ncbi:hypothetical protein P7H20_26560 [Paenibacillus larvae]|nr:hypothetical protein [Paenibacillus larvae]MDT2277691.1 hypothetical protein [Paenibacillus larvae]
MQIPIFQAIGDFIGSVWNTIKTVSAAVWNGIKSFLVGLWNGIVSIATPSSKASGTLFHPFGTPLKRSAVPFGTGSKVFCKAFGMGLNRQRSCMERHESVIIEPVTLITEKVTSAFEGMKGIVLDVWEGIKSGIKAVLQTGLFGLSTSLSMALTCRLSY